MGNEIIACTGRFNGAPFDLMIPIGAVIGIFAKETGQGLVFQPEETQPPPANENKPEAKLPSKSHLKLVK
jgi:stringent starvation protein B